MMWVGVRMLGANEAGKFGARTIGLEAFVGYEPEMSPAKLTPVMLADRVYGPANICLALDLFCRRVNLLA